MIPSLNATALDTSDPTTRGFVASFAAAGASGNVGGGEALARDPRLQDGELLRMAQDAESQAATFVTSNVRSQWSRSYKAYRNQHADGSKYLSLEYRGRSKFFRPKTRSAVKKKMAQAAAALFGSGDVVSINAQDEADEYQVASAALKQEIINYRLSRSTRRNGIRWFIIAVGAMQTGAITGLIISKQTWRYREDKTKPRVMGKKPAVIEDRPDIALLPPENVLFDPNCDWTNPAQSSQYVIVHYPSSVDEALDMIRSNTGCGNIRFREDITREDLQSAVGGGAPYETTATRTARNAGRDPTMQTSGRFGRVWLNEVFMRVGDVDYVYWTINNTKLISDPVPVSDAYPHLAGDRPVVIGYSEIEAFRPFPMSTTEALQGLQQEINDQANLRLDHMKQVVSPPAKVVRGNRVDLQQLQRRGPNGVVFVNNKDDIEWFQQPDVPQSAYLENNVVTADFDSLAGVFDAGSVMNNRQMGETVGGMKLLAASGNPMADFDLNVFVETWAEPVLAQVMKLIEYYESDETVLAICGQKAKLFERFGISEITDQLLLMETTLVVQIGVGASNVPEQKLKNFTNAWAVASQVIGAGAQMGLCQPPAMRTKSILDFIFSGANIKDGAERFFGMVDDSGQYPQPQGNPEADAKMAKVEAEREKTQTDAQVKMATLAQKREEMAARLEAEHMKSLAEIGKAFLTQRHDAELQAREHAHDHFTRALDHAHGFEKDERQAQRSAVDGEAKHKRSLEMHDRQAMSKQRHDAFMAALQHIMAGPGGSPGSSE